MFQSIKYINLCLFHQQGQEGQDSKTLCCLCCASGPISGKHNIPVSGYVPGEAIQINAELINHSNRNCEIWMELVQVSHFNKGVLYIVITTIHM